MALFDRTRKIVVPYSLDITVEALKKAMPTLGGFKIDGFDEDTKTAYLSTGISWVSWGEDITVSLAQAQTGNTVISILSTPKFGFIFGGAIEFGKNRENIEKIGQALSDELDNYPQLGSKQKTAAPGYTEEDP